MNEPDVDNAELHSRILRALEPFKGAKINDLVKMQMIAVVRRERAIFIAESEYGLTREYATKLVESSIKAERTSQPSHQH